MSFSGIIFMNQVSPISVKVSEAKFSDVARARQANTNCKVVS
jgi:hypothetical protein